MYVHVRPPVADPGFDLGGGVNHYRPFHFVKFFER